MTTTTTTPTPMLFDVVEKTYEVSGAELRAAIEQTQLSQREFAKRIGLKDGSRLCRICNQDTVRLKADTVARICLVLSKYGVPVTCT